MKNAFKIKQVIPKSSKNVIYIKSYKIKHFNKKLLY